MEQALTYIYYIYDSFIDLAFNRIEIQSGVTIGWIMIAVVLFSLIIRSVLNLPRGISLHRPSTTTYYNKYGGVTGYSTRKRG